MTRSEQEVADWAAEGRRYVRGVLAEFGQDPDLMQQNPGAVLHLMNEALSEEIPADLSQDDRDSMLTLLMAFLAEFLIVAHGAHWAWLDEPASAGGGRWVVTGIPHPLGQDTEPVDVGGIADAALSGTEPVSFTALVNEAELRSGMRVIKD